MSTNAVSTQQSRGKNGLSRRSVSAVPSLLADPLDVFVNPFSLLRRMQQEMNRAFSSDTAVARTDDATSTVWVPPIEVSFRDGNFVIAAELPGVDNEDIQVAITDDAVVIRGEREVQSESDRGGVRRTELHYGEFYRAIPLPDGAAPDKARAELRNGVLQITLPVSEGKQGVRQIPVQTGDSSQSSNSSDRSSRPSEQSSSTKTESGSVKAA